ncbi:MAG: exodeoxyribonuclease VII large subunit [Phycisphaeraceae bacterium]
MPRLPFARPEPEDQPPRGGGQADVPDEPRDDAPLSVSQASAVIREVLNVALPRTFRVQGEISNLSRRSAGGHWFFSIKDDAATLRCVCFASNARRVSAEVDNGVEVVCTGRVDMYPAQGQVQLYVESIEPVGQGALEAELRRRIEALREKGWLDEARKQPLPSVPRRVAVVTSRAAAALQDVINTTQQRWPGCELLLVDVPVQGASAAPKIAAALAGLSRFGQAQRIDAIVLTRGGGSLEDLWAFNEGVVAEAVYRCPIPIVAAIGHETDVTVAELVADRRAATPTQAAMLLVPDRDALDQQLDHAAARLQSALRRRLERARDRLDRAARHRLFRSPRVLIEDRRERLARCSARLAAAPHRALERAARRLDAADRQLHAIHPTRVLERGYTYTLAGDTDDPAAQQQRLLRSSDEARKARRLVTVFSDGRVVSVPLREMQNADASSDHSTASPAPRRESKPRKASNTAKHQPTLFGS